MCTHSFKAARSEVYISPGLSKSSRSNAIAISADIAPHVADHICCPIGHVLVLKFGGLLMPCLNIHLPHGNHPQLKIENAISMLESLLEDVFIRLDFLKKRMRTTGALPVPDYLWLLGADLNNDMQETSNRSFHIASLLSKTGISFIPITPGSHTFEHAEVGGTTSRHIIDWLGCSQYAAATILEANAHAQTGEFVRENVAIITPHLPLEISVNLELAIRYQNLQNGNSRNHLTRREVFHHMPKGWLPDQQGIKEFQGIIEHVANQNGLNSIDDISRAILSSSKEIRSRKNVNRYSDSPEILTKIAQRKASKSRSVASELQKQIISLRAAGRGEHLDRIAAKIALGNWSSAQDLKALTKCRQTHRKPNEFEYESSEQDKCCLVQKSLIFAAGHTSSSNIHDSTHASSKGPLPASNQRETARATLVIPSCESAEVIRAMEEVYGGLARDHADNEVNMNSLLEMKNEINASNDLVNETVIDIDSTLNSIAKIPKGKVPDPQGIVGEAVSELPYSVKSELQDMFNSRTLEDNWSNKANNSHWHDNWKYIDTLLIPKGQYQARVHLLDFRPIAILCVFLKVYMRILSMLMFPYLAIEGFIQFGARAHHRCSELIMLIRLIIEKCKEWGSPCIVVSIDLERAFESVKLSSVLAHWKKRGVPVRLRYAAFKEIAGERFVRYSMGGLKTDYLPKHRGLIQGSPESSFFFASMISDLLGDLDRDWKSRGFGIKFGKWSNVQEAWQKWIQQNKQHNHMMIYIVSPFVFLLLLMTFTLLLIPCRKLRR